MSQRQPSRCGRCGMVSPGADETCVRCGAVLRPPSVNQRNAGPIPPPSWVSVGLWGIKTRNGAQAYMWTCVALVMASLLGGLLVLSRTLMLLALGGGMSALRYLLCIK